MTPEDPGPVREHPVYRDEHTPKPIVSNTAHARLSLPSLDEVRHSILSLPVFKPRWKPWSPASAAKAAIGFAIVFGLLVVVTFRETKRWAPRLVFHAAAAPAVSDVPAAAAPAAPRADAALSRERRSPISGGLLMLPPAFESADGRYDLLLHLHGNTDLVEESVAFSGLNTVLVIMNLGTGSGPYEDRFANPGVLPEIIERAQALMEKRGLAHATLRRLALSGWSAGYGGVLKVLEQPALAARVDAVLLMDGIHVGYAPQSHDLLLDRLAPFTRFAKEAVEGRRMFSITHTHITPLGNYAGTRETTDALLRLVGVSREPGGDRHDLPILRSLEGVMPKRLIHALDPDSTARRGGLVVRDYTGDQPEDHMLHLMNMAVTVLPDLKAWWAK
jgi:hypothetical protein